MGFPVENCFEGCFLGQANLYAKFAIAKMKTHESFDPTGTIYFGLLLSLQNAHLDLPMRNAPPCRYTMTAFLLLALREGV